MPVKDCYNMLYKGDRVVVAEFAIHPQDSVDSVWVKLAHTQDIQGWIRETDMIHSFVPTDSISQSIYLFSDTHASYFIVVFALFVAVWLFRAFRRKQLRMVYFNDIDSVYPLLLCLLMAFRLPRFMNLSKSLYPIRGSTFISIPLCHLSKFHSSCQLSY